MRVAILGAGPAGLYLAYLIKRRRGDAEVAVIEQNPHDATFGTGVVFSDRALAFLEADDPETSAAITPQLETWDDIALDLLGERIVIDGVGFAAIGRLQLLALLQERARTVGVEPVYRRAVAHLDELGDADPWWGPTASTRWFDAPMRRPSPARSASSATVSPGSAPPNRSSMLQADLSRHRARPFQRPPLPLCAGPEHLHRRGQRRHFSPRRPRPQGACGNSRDLRKRVRRRARRPPADLQQFGLAAISQGSQRALVGMAGMY